MAANLSGMFGQLNNVISQNPMAQGGVGTGLLNQTFARGGSLLGGMTGNDPYGYMAQPAKQVYGQEQLGNLDLSTVEGLQQAAGIYGKMGDQAKQVAMTQAANEKQQTELAFRQAEAAKQSLADRAEKIGLTSMAATIRSGGHPDLKDVAKTIREEEQKAILLKRGEPGRRIMARQAGFTDEEYQTDLKGLTDEQLTKVLSGEEGDTKAFLDAEGNETLLSTDKYGRVWIDGKRVRPDEAGLKQAPQKTQEVVTQANALIKSITEIATKDIQELQDAAKDSVRSLQVTDGAIELLNEGIAEGIFAPIEIALGKVANEFGIAPEWAAKASNAEAFAATMGNEVATIIKQFGAGTGLSDADREYAEKIAGGNIKMTKATLVWLIKARRTAAKNILKHHGTMMDGLQQANLDPSIFNVLTIRTTLPKKAGAEIQLSPSAQRYLEPS